ncbi:hypothetical protein L208DRAFT_1425885 [Tricholoma matsutake]|nr:hypothetical protein L208DRAFT_1425885 [Tricholoma matsutake 945]
MEHPMSTYCDLDFLVPNIKKGFLYWDDINIGGNIVDHLNAHVVVEFCGQGLICSYNAAICSKQVHILVCTDAAGMGCNIADVDIDIQWKAPTNLSSWVQHASCQGLAIMICIQTLTRGRGHGPGHGRHGQKCRTHSGMYNIIAPIDELTTIADDAPREGLYSYIQMTICH